MNPIFYKVSPSDLQPRKALGIQLNFSPANVFNSTYTTAEAIKTNIINYLLTGRGERYCNTELGSGLTDLLFENISENQLRGVRDLISDRLTELFPNITITQFNLTSQPDFNTVEVNFKFEITNSRLTEQEINIEIGV